MLSKQMQQALVEQINKEFHSAYIYLGMTAYFENENYKGMAAWMNKQVKEEINHAMKFFHHIYERSGEVTLGTIEKVSVDYKNPLDVFKAGLEHEKFITSSIHGLYDLALAEKDYGTQELLRWYISEQVEEEANFEYVISLLEKSGDNPGGLMILDEKLGARE